MSKKSSKQVPQLDQVAAVEPPIQTPEAVARLEELLSETPTIKKTTEGIAPEDLAAINKAKQKVGFTALRAQNALLENQLAELEQKNLTYGLFLKYNLTEHDQINETTGQIVRGLIK